jgi:nucleotide-binding universal stress UspA family protein
MSINSEDRPWPKTISHDDVDWPAADQRILVPFCDAVNETETSLLSASITVGTDGELYVLHTTDGEEANSDRIRDEAELQMEIQDAFSIPVTQVEEPHSTGVLDSVVDDYAITATVVDRAETTFFSYGRDEKTVAKGCHRIVGTRMDRFERPSSILVPVAKGPHSGLAARIGEAVARAYDCWLELFHVLPADAGEREELDAEKLLDAYETQLGADVDVDHHVTTAADPATEIIEHSAYHDVTVLGAPEKGRLRRLLFGSTTTEVQAEGDSGPVLTVHRDTDESFISRWF